MLYKEVISVCSEIHTKYINTVCGQNVEFCLTLYLVMHDLITGLRAANIFYIYRHARARIRPPTHARTLKTSLVEYFN